MASDKRRSPPPSVAIIHGQCGVFITSYPRNEGPGVCRIMIYEVMMLVFGFAKTQSHNFANTQKHKSSRHTLFLLPFSWFDLEIFQILKSLSVGYRDISVIYDFEHCKAPTRTAICPCTTTCRS
jgi:hypothetical protein